MKTTEKSALTRHGDWSDEAIAARLAAAVAVTGVQQQELAQSTGIPKTTLNTQIKKGRPSVDFMTVLYRDHRIDFNFVLYGDYAQLPGDVQDQLLAALSA